MSSCEWELQKAVYTALTQDTGLMSKVTGVYDHVPQGASFPYIALWEMQSRDRSNVAETMTEVRVKLAVYARERGSKTVLDIMAIVKALLHQANMSVTGYSLHSCCFTESILQQLQDGLTYSGKMEFSVYLEG